MMLQALVQLPAFDAATVCSSSLLTKYDIVIVIVCVYKVFYFAENVF